MERHKRVGAEDESFELCDVVPRAGAAFEGSRPGPICLFGSYVFILAKTRAADKR